MKSKYLSLLLWAFTISFVAITFVPRSLDDTMFMDGTTYAAISRNMAIGKGSFWRPYFADSFWLPYDNGGFFSGHPPLLFGMQSLLFKAIGDSTAVENIYNLIILIGSILLIVLIWGKLFEKEETLRPYSWLPVLCWYGILIVWYSMPNNFLDSTMCLFCLASCYFQLLAFSAITRKKVLYSILAGLFILSAILTKGPVGLYPLGFTALYTLVYQRNKLREAIISTSISLLTLALCFVLILCYKPAYQFLAVYFEGQIVQSLMQKREKIKADWTAHFYVLSELTRSLYPHLLVLAGLVGTALVFRLKVKPAPEILKIALFTFLIAFSAIAPMLISVKQYPHYLLPSLPFVALFFASLFVEKIHALIQIQKTPAIFAISGAMCVCWFVTFRKIKSPEPNIMANNIRIIQKYVPKATTLGLCDILYQNADIHSYFQRYHQLSVSTDWKQMKYVLADSSCLGQFDPVKDLKIPLEGGFSLIERNSIADSHKSPTR